MPRQPVGTMYFLGSRRAKPRSLSACPLTLSFSPSPPCFPAAISKSICLPFPRTVPLSIPFNLACKCRLYIFRRTGRGQPAFPGPGPIFVSASEPKGLPPPFLLLCVPRRTKKRENVRRESISRENLLRCFGRTVVTRRKFRILEGIVSRGQLGNGYQLFSRWTFPSFPLLALPPLLTASWSEIAPFRKSLAHCSSSRDLS